MTNDMVNCAWCGKQLTEETTTKNYLLRGEPIHDRCSEELKKSHDYVDELGHEHAMCSCGNDCSTHPDAANPLDYCAWCGEVTCSDCRFYMGTAPKCRRCYHAEGGEQG